MWGFENNSIVTYVCSRGLGIRTLSVSFSKTPCSAGMARRWRIKPNRNLRENARLVVPLMFDDFLSHRDRVINHPRLKLELHRMRLAGKTLRYAMEVFGVAFQSDFSACLEEVKHVIETMGNVHDCDVNIPWLQGQLREIRLFNRGTQDAKDRIATSALVHLIRDRQAFRRGLFEAMVSMLEQWRRGDFRARLIESMIPD